MDNRELEKRIGYTFKNKKLLIEALTHSSYANERQDGTRCNERLEFLGDSVLGFISAEHFFHHFKHLPEGELTKRRAYFVCEKSLSEFARTLGIGEFLLFGKGEVLTGGKDRPSILADAFEAVLAAIYLDGGIEPAKKFVFRFIDKADEEKPAVTDYKTTLQEIVQRNPEEAVEYVLVGESGPDHNKTFSVEVHLNSNVIGRGLGRSKKIAEQRPQKRLSSSWDSSHEAYKRLRLCAPCGLPSSVQLLQSEEHFGRCESADGAGCARCGARRHALVTRGDKGRRDSVFRRQLYGYRPGLYDRIALGGAGVHRRKRLQRHKNIHPPGCR